MNNAISTWLNSQHPWLQEAAHRLLSKDAIDGGDIADFVRIIKTPLVATTPKAVPRTYPAIGASGAGAAAVRLTSIGDIVGIDNLAPRQPLTFPSGNLTVVYGHTGAGKSGYARILKKVCGKAGAPDLKPNVFKVTPPVRQCTVAFDVAGVPKQVQWTANSASIPDLQPVDIFDTTSGRLYLESETEVSFSPPELVLFSDLVVVCKRVEAIFTAEETALPKLLPQLPPLYSPTKVGTRFNGLTALAKPLELAALYPWTKEDETKLQELNAKKAVTDPASEATKRRAVKLRLDGLIAKLVGARKAVTPEACNEIYDSVKAAELARRAATEGVAALTQSAKLDGVGTATWQALWEAARAYSTGEAYPDQSYPYVTDGARCVLCQQELAAEARRRLLDFEGYVTGTLETAAKKAGVLAKQRLDALPAIPEDEALATTCQAAELSPEVTEQLKAAWLEIKDVADHLRLVPLAEIPKGLQIVDCPLMAQLTALSEAAETAAQGFDKDALTFDGKQVAEAILELEAKKWTATQKNAIDAEIVRLKSIAQIHQWSKLTSTTNLSKKAGDLSEALITDAYVARFNAELKKLGAGRIQVELVKTRVMQGQVKHKIQLKGLRSVHAGEILSEGENRIVTLAAFLATVTAKPDRAPFVFDDPISSLDQTYEESTIDRLIELSQDRQVIVFTHRLSLVGIISDKADPKIVTIKHEAWGAGQPGEVPLFAKKPEGALKDLKGGRLPRAKKALENEGADTYYPLAKSICSDIRILVERIVELVLLADVIQRHRRAVNTYGKIHQLSKITRDDCALVEKFMSKYSSYEHSQPSESPVALPTPAEFEADLDELLAWHEEFKNRAA